jgi:hypothetical protein
VEARDGVLGFLEPDARELAVELDRLAALM